MSCWINFVGSILALLAINCVLLYPIHRAFPDRDVALKPSGILQERMSSTRWAEEHDHKRSVALNLKMAMGWRIFYQLVGRADVVVEGFRPGVAKRLGTDYETLKEINRQILYCAITGYGQNGPYRDLVGHDINYISQGGAVDIVSQPGTRPPIPGNLIGEMAAGGMQAAIGILAALMKRSRLH